MAWTLLHDFGTDAIADLLIKIGASTPVESLGKLQEILWPGLANLSGRWRWRDTGSHDEGMLCEVWRGQIWAERPVSIVQDAAERWVVYGVAGVSWMRPPPPLAACRTDR